MKKAIQTILLLTAFTPLVVSTFFISPFIDGKIFFLRAVAFAVFVLITVLIFNNNRKNENDKAELVGNISTMLRDKLFITTTVVTGLMAISTLFAYDKSMAFFGEPLRAEGFLTMFTGYILYVCFYLVFKKKEWDRFFVWTSVVTAILFLIQVRQSALGMFRSDSLSGNPIFLASYYIFSIFAGYMVIRLGSALKNTGYRILGYSGIISAIVGVLLTKTRGTMLALAVAVVVMLVIAIIKGRDVSIKKVSLRKYGIGLLIAFLCFGGIFFATRQAQFWTYIPGLNRLAEIGISDTSSSSRLEYTKISVQSFFADPNITRMLVGWGQVNYQFFWIKNYNPIFYYYDPGIADHAHNALIDVLVMGGILGLLAYGSMWIFFLKKIRAWVRKNLFIGLGLIFWAVAYFVNNLFAFETAMTLVVFYSMLAFVSSHYEE